MSECTCCQEPPLVYRRWMPMLDDLSDFVTVTMKGGIVVLADRLDTEDFAVLSLSAAWLAHRCGRKLSEKLSADEILATGGVLVRPSIEDLKEELTKLARAGVVTQAEGRYSVDERVVLQVHARKAPRWRAEIERWGLARR